jgi:hypothetical protein
MNDIELIRSLSPDVPLASAEDLRPARTLLAAEIATEFASPGLAAYRRDEAATGACPIATSPRRRRPPLRRFAIAATAATAVAAGATAAVFVIPGPGQVPAGRPAGRPPVAVGPSAGPRAVRTPSVTAPVPAGVSVAAAHFLRRAAIAALRQPAVVPRPDQWIYSETEGPGGRYKTQTWLPAEGSKNGLIRPAGHAPACSVAQAEATGCLPEVGYFPGLPTSPRPLLKYLVRVAIASKADEGPGKVPEVPTGQAWLAWRANDLGKAIDFLLGQTYLLPAQRAAVYELLAQTPGFRVVHGVRDPSGREGVGIAWRFEGHTTMIIFNPRTYAYLGDTWVSLVRIAIVDGRGQLP